MRGPHCVHELTRALLSSARAFDGHAFARDRHSLRRLISEPSVRGLTAKTPKRQNARRGGGGWGSGRTSGAMRRCPQTQVRAKRSTLRASARAKHFSRMPGNSSSFLTLARSDRDLRMRLGPRELTAQARAISQRSAGGPAPRKAARPKISTADPARAAPRAQPAAAFFTVSLRSTGGNPASPATATMALLVSK